MRRRTAIGAGLAALAGAAAWAVAAVPPAYVEAQLAVGDELRTLLAEHPGIARTAAHDVVFALAYAVAGTVLLLAWRVRHVVPVLVVVATADIVENLSLRAMARRQALGALDEVMRTAGIVKWIGVVVVLLSTGWALRRRTRRA